MSSFLIHHGVIVALVCAACAVAYGLLTTRSLLALSPGNEVMVRISGAVQEGATLREAFAATVAHTRETYAHPGQEEVHAR